MASVMTDHFIIASWARDSVIAGDLEALREPLQTLTDYEYPEPPSAEWRTSLHALQEAARATGQAATLSEAASGVADMARRCGECHATTGGGPRTPVETPEQFSKYGEATFTGRMYRHQWGAEQLWHGLTAPSDEAWQLGAAALVQAPSEMEGELPARFGEALARVRALGAQAAELRDPTRRAELYGELLASCARCHARSDAASLRGF